MGLHDNGTTIIVPEPDHGNNGQLIDGYTDITNEDSNVKLADETYKNGPDDTANGAEDDQKQTSLTFSSIVANIKSDPVYRHRFIHTAVVCWAFVGLGVVAIISGPTFPDLMLIIDEDVATTSWIFTTGSLGYFTGSLISGVLYDRFNKVLLLALSSFGIGVTSLLIPHCTSLAWLMFMRFVWGCFAGGLDTGGNADVLYVWGAQSGPFMQAMHFGFSVGALISPILAEPFLAKRIHVCELVNETITSIDDLQGSPQAWNTSRPVGLNVSLNLHLPDGATSLANATAGHWSNATEVERCGEVYEETSVHWAYFIASLMVLSSTVGFLYVYRRLKSSGEISHSDVQQASKADRIETVLSRQQMSTGLKVLFLTLLTMFLGAYCMIEDCFSAYLMTFGLIHLGWDKQTGSLANAAYWIPYAAGRFSGIFVVGFCTSSTMLTTYLLLLTVSYIGFFLSTAFLYYPLIWVFIMLIGVSTSVIFPTIYSFTSDRVLHVTGKVSSLFMAVIAVMGMTFPLLLGNLMEYYHPMWYTYIFGIMLGALLVIYALVRFLVWFLLDRKKNTSKDNTSSEEVRETELKLLKSK